MSFQKQNFFVRLVDQILEGKMVNENQKTIDLHIYKLYNLTFFEVLIVEPELEDQMTEEEYNTMEIEFEDQIIN